MMICEHASFGDLVTSTQAHLADQGLDISEAIIEKDYYVTEALRLIAEHGGDSVLFKGGTSLSKGWNIIQRFSEDIDIFIDPEACDPRLGNPRQVDRHLKGLRDVVGGHPALTFASSNTTGGSARSDRFEYTSRFRGSLQTSVLVETGIGSGREPAVTVSIESYVARFLRDTSVSLGAGDEQWRQPGKGGGP